MFFDSTPSVVLPFSFLRLLTEMRKTSFVVVKVFYKIYVRDMDNIARREVDLIEHTLCYNTQSKTS